MLRRTAMTLAAAGGLLTAIPDAWAAAGVPDEKLPILAAGQLASATSQLAERRSTQAMVLRFARLEIAEQAAVATAFGQAGTPISLPPDAERRLAALRAAPGAAFDRLYIREQIAGHRLLRRLHASYARTGRDAMARGGSIVALAAIETHLAMLQTIQRTLA